MHKVASNTASRTAVASRMDSRRRVRWDRLGRWALGTVVAALALAWFDGGEEPLHAISQPVEMRAGGTA